MATSLFRSRATGTRSNYEVSLTSLAEGGKELAKKVGDEAGARIVKLYDKVKAKLTGGNAEALADLEQQPEDADNQAVLRLQLKKALEADRCLGRI